jgi:hypothetical protein
MRNFKKNPYAEGLIKNGHKVMITKRIEGKEIIVDEYFISPEQIAEELAERDTILESRRVQG